MPSATEGIRLDEEHALKACSPFGDSGFESLAFRHSSPTLEAPMSYLLTVRMTLNGPDDPAARDEAREVLERMDLLRYLEEDPDDTEALTVKLQKVYPDKPPRKVRLIPGSPDAQSGRPPEGSDVPRP